MHAVVRYESLFGSTRDIAQAVAEGVRAAWPGAVVDCACIDAPEHARSLSAADLLIVGAPTHFWGLTSRISRAMEREYELRMMRAGQGTVRRLAAETQGMREWLATLPPGRGTAAATFDTRMDRALSGGAAPGIAARLHRRGYRLVVEPKAFIVAGIAGPLRTGESEQARRWADQIARSTRSR
jgi:hypothetical protein